MVIEERAKDECKKERRIWLLISIISGTVFIGLMTAAVSYDTRFKYGFYVVSLTCIAMFTSFVMYAFTRYVSTKEIVSILVRKVVGNGD
jgi:bacteriorhodopsin